MSFIIIYNELHDYYPNIAIIRGKMNFVMTFIYIKNINLIFIYEIL